jgi:hypothetical protein
MSKNFFIYIPIVPTEINITFTALNLFHFGCVSSLTNMQDLLDRKTG